MEVFIPVSLLPNPFTYGMPRRRGADVPAALREKHGRGVPFAAHEALRSDFGMVKGNVFRPP